MKKAMILTRERSEEEKRRRHLFGDKGAKFSKAKIPKLTPPPRDWDNNDNDYKGHFVGGDI